MIDYNSLRLVIYYSLRCGLIIDLIIGLFTDSLSSDKRHKKQPTFVWLNGVYKRILLLLAKLYPSVLSAKHFYSQTGQKFNSSWCRVILHKFIKSCTKKLNNLLINGKTFRQCHVFYYSKSNFYHILIKLQWKFCITWCDAAAVFCGYSSFS